VIGWLDCVAGASGDMFLGALVDAGAPVEAIRSAIAALAVEPIELELSTVTRHGLGATKVDVVAPHTVVTRTWGNIRERLSTAQLPDRVRATALEAFERLARAEADVHRTSPEQVHFHEVGGLDAIADVVGTAAGLAALDIDHLAASTVTLGSGMTRGEHGMVPVPGPAVLALLRDAEAPVWSGPAPYEMCTPTGAALLATTVSSWGPMPPMRISSVGMGAGGRDLDELPNLLRLVIGVPADERSADQAESAVVLETNVDDLDPRLWPAVLEELLAAGASDAWLTPILMKKGRPAHTLHVLCPPPRADRMREIVFTHTSTIGLRSHVVDKVALRREQFSVQVHGQPVGVKAARHDGRVVNVSVEYDDVRRAAEATGLPVAEVLREATALAHDTVRSHHPLP
jgi:hypothetical protein